MSIPNMESIPSIEEAVDLDTTKETERFEDDFQFEFSVSYGRWKEEETLKHQGKRFEFLEMNHSDHDQILGDKTQKLDIPQEEPGISERLPVYDCLEDNLSSNSNFQLINSVVSTVKSSVQQKADGFDVEELILETSSLSAPTTAASFQTEQYAAFENLVETTGAEHSVDSTGASNSLNSTKPEEFVEQIILDPKTPVHIDKLSIDSTSEILDNPVESSDSTDPATRIAMRFEELPEEDVLKLASLKASFPRANAVARKFGIPISRELLLSLEDNVWVRGDVSRYFIFMRSHSRYD